MRFCHQLTAVHFAVYLSASYLLFRQSGQRDGTKHKIDQ